MQVKTSGLTGQALNYAVAVSEGYGNFRLNIHTFNKEPLLDRSGKATWLKTLNYSTDWAQGGPIIEREGIGFFQKKEEGYCQAAKPSAEFVQRGQTPLIAAMRCYVASKLGETVEIPGELTE